MNKTLASFLAIVAACLVDVTPSKGASPSPAVVARVTSKPTASQPLRAAIPMVFKQHKFPGARSSWDEQRSSTVVVQNADRFATSPLICFYPGVQGSVPLSSQSLETCFITPDPVPAGASYAFQLDALGLLPPGFFGSARVYSAGLVTAIATHRFADDAFRTISGAGAIRPADATDRAYLPTFYSDRSGEWGTQAVSALFAQNLDAVPNELTIQFFAAGSSAPSVTRTVQLNPGRAAVIDAPELFLSFSGSAVVTAKKLDATGNGAGPGLVGAHVFELADGEDPTLIYNIAKAYNGFARGSTTIHMGTALCRAFGSATTASQSTAYAIQNVSDQDASVEVTFQPGGAKAWLAVKAHAKVSLRTCNVQGIGPTFSGSADLLSTADIVAIGKAQADDQASGTGATTAFESVETGAAEVGIPFVTWSNDVEYALSGAARAYIAVQNIGDAYAFNVVARYFSGDGGWADVPLGAIAPGAKVNTNPDHLRNLPPPNPPDPTHDGRRIEQAIIDHGLGSVEIIGSAGDRLSALVRIQRRSGLSSRVTVAEDYVASAKLEYATCDCKLAVPPGLLAFEYNRIRTGQKVVGVCSVNPPMLTTQIQVGKCDDCGRACSGRLSSAYSRKVAASTLPAPGSPPGPSDPLYARYLSEDLAELYRLDPCNSKGPTTAFQYTYTCKAP